MEFEYSIGEVVEQINVPYNQFKVYGADYSRENGIAKGVEMVEHDNFHGRKPLSPDTLNYEFGKARGYGRWSERVAYALLKKSPLVEGLLDNQQRYILDYALTMDIEDERTMLDKAQRSELYGVQDWRFAPGSVEELDRFTRLRDILRARVGAE